MATDPELIACPGGCGKQVHIRANECPSCGYRPDGARYEELLGGLSLISSILAWIGLETVIALIVPPEDPRSKLLNDWAFGIWIVGAIVLLAVMVLAEGIRRRTIGLRNIQASKESLDEARSRCSRLVWIFFAALSLIGVGIVLLAFLYSVVHGIIAVVAVVVGLAFILWELH